MAAIVTNGWRGVGTAMFVGGVASLIWLAGSIDAGSGGTAFANGAPRQGPCQALLLDLSGLAAGTILGEQFAASGIHISAEGFPGSEDAVIVFDSNATGTGDTDDLEVDRGNLAIIPHDLTDRRPRDGLVDDPEDSAAGGIQKYAFDHDRIISSFVFVDKDHGPEGSATAFGSSNDDITSVPIPNEGNGSVQTVAINAAGVRRLEISYKDSGAVTGIDLGCVSLPVPTPTPTGEAQAAGQPVPTVTVIGEAVSIPPQITRPPRPEVARGPSPTVAAAAVLPTGGGSPGGEGSFASLTLTIAAAGLALCAFVVAIAYRRNKRLPVAPVLMRKTHSDWRPADRYR